VLEDKWLIIAVSEETMVAVEIYANTIVITLAPPLVAAGKVVFSKLF
jgi:hypothetical protein